MVPSMFYRLLGKALWRGGKLYIRGRYGRRMPSRPIAGIAALLVVAGTVAALLATRHGGDSA
jgi:hypothetical protein